MDEITWEWRKLHNEELNHIIWMIKSRMRWKGHEAHMGERISVYRVLVGKPERKRPLGRPICRWGIILKWIFKK